MKLPLLSAAFAAGVLLAARWEAAPSALALFALAAVLATALLASSRRSLLPGLLAIALVLGALRADAAEPAGVDALTPYHDAGTLLVRGTVERAPEPTGAHTRLRLGVSEVDDGGGWAAAEAIVLVTLRESPRIVEARDRPYFRYGDRLLLEGELVAPEPFEDFDYPAYLARQGIRTVMRFPSAELIGEGEGSPFYRALHAVRWRLARALAASVPEPQAAMGQALLLGMRDGLPDDLVDDFRATGTAHVLAISGLHVGVLLGISLSASAWLFGRRHRLYLMAPFVLVWLYALLAGASPSVLRAATMGSVFLAARVLGRPGTAMPALGLAAAVMVALSPGVLWSVSFQLSFAAVAGIALLRPRFGEWPFGGRDEDERGESGGPLAWLADAVGVSIAATLATLPLLAFHFERVSLVGILATPLVLPALPLALVLYAVTAAVGLVVALPAQVVGLLSWVVGGYVALVVGLFARLPVASVEVGRVAPFLVWSYYGVLMLAVSRRGVGRALARLPEWWRAAIAPALRGVRVPWWASASALAVAALVWALALLRPGDMLEVVFLDVGQGDAAFISTPLNRQIVVDGGPGRLDMVRFLGENMPPGDRTLDLVVLTHPHADHLTGLLEAMERYEVGAVLERRTGYDGPGYAAWRELAAAEGAVVAEAVPGQRIDMGDGAVVQVLGPPSRLLRGTESDVDNASVVVRIAYGDVSFLLTGDMFREGEAALVAGDGHLESDVLKVGHHGSRTSSSGAFLDAVRPAVAVISAGVDNRFGHPHPETLEALHRHVDAGMVFNTSERGDVRFVTDGKVLYVSTER